MIDPKKVFNNCIFRWELGGSRSDLCSELCACLQVNDNILLCGALYCVAQMNCLKNLNSIHNPYAHYC